MVYKDANPDIFFEYSGAIPSSICHESYVNTMKAVNRYNLAIVLFTALGSYTYGFNSSIISSVIGLPSFLGYFGLTSEGAKSAWSAQMIGGMSAPISS